jgi:DNA-binding response OmpR family regulator
MGSGQTRILLIEDDETFVRFIKRILVGEGYSVITAANGRDGLVAIRQYQPTVVLLDMGLPVMDGEAFLAIYHSQDENKVPIIVMSGREGNPRKLPPVAGFLNKPFEVQELVELVAHFASSVSI